MKDQDKTKEQLINELVELRQRIAELEELETERKRVEEALQYALEESRERQAEISALLEGSRAVLEYREFQDAARSIFDSCKNLIGATGGYVALLSKDGTRNEVLFVDSGGLPCTVDPNLPMPIRGLREEAHRTGKAVYDNDFAKSEWVKFIPEGHVRLDNVLFAPLVIEGKVVGLLGLANKPGGFTENDARMASAFGEFATVAFLNSQTLEALEWEAGVNTSIAELSSALLSPASLEDISYLVLEHAQCLTGSEFGFVGYIDPQTGYLVSPTLTRDIWDTCQVPDKDIVFKEFRGLWGWVLNNRKPLLTNTPADDPRSSGTPPGHIPIHRFLSAPALMGETLVGQVAVANSDHGYTERDLALVERLAALYAIAVQRKWAEAEITQRNAELAAQNAIAATISQSLGLDAILNTALDNVLEVMAVDAAGIFLVEGDRLDFRAYRNLPPHFVAQVSELRVGESLPGLVAQTGEPIVVQEEVSQDPRLTKEAEREEGLQSFVCVPLKAKGKVVGVMPMATYRRREFSPEDVALVTAIGQQIGVAVDNAQLYEEIREKSGQLEGQVEHLERFRKATVQREFRMVELKEKIKELEEKLKGKGKTG